MECLKSVSYGYCLEKRRKNKKSDGNVWIDAKILPENHSYEKIFSEGIEIIISPTGEERPEITISTGKIIAIVELTFK